MIMIYATKHKWLKIIDDGTTAYSLNLLGDLIIDSVKVTAWNPVQVIMH